MNLADRLLAVSPHLDDAVLSCGLSLAAHSNAIVSTVFTAAPERNMTTDWDRDSGFAGAFEAMRARKAEDERALKLLGASPLHLPFCDAQYQSSPSEQAVATALKEILCETKPAALLVPLGLFHSDHTLVADACLASVESFDAPAVFAYEDVPYGKIPCVLQARLSDLLERGITASPVEFTGLEIDGRHRELKQAALAEYESQLRAFGPAGRAGLESPERYWRLGQLSDSADKHS
jgi:LmbE family N-acetylglucosaminyl deacetylase